MKIARENKALTYSLSKYKHNKEIKKLIYIVHKNSFSLRD